MGPLSQGQLHHSPPITLKHEPVSVKLLWNVTSLILQTEMHLHSFLFVYINIKVVWQ